MAISWFISVDDHLIEPARLWQERVSPRWRERATLDRVEAGRREHARERGGRVVAGPHGFAVERDGRQAAAQDQAVEADPRDDTEPDGRDTSTAADPETTALRLLQANLGARPLDEAG